MNILALKKAFAGPAFSGELGYYYLTNWPGWDTAIGVRAWVKFDTISPDFARSGTRVGHINGITYYSAHCPQLRPDDSDLYLPGTAAGLDLIARFDDFHPEFNLGILERICGYILSAAKVLGSDKLLPGRL